MRAVRYRHVDTVAMELEERLVKPAGKCYVRRRGCRRFVHILYSHHPIQETVLELLRNISRTFSNVQIYIYLFKYSCK